MNEGALGLALAASLSWGVGDFVSGVKTRSLGVLGVLFPAQVAGLALMAVLVGARGAPWPGNGVLWAIPAACAGTLGLVAFFRGMATGAISVVAPVAGVSAVIPVGFGLAAGDALGGLTAAGIAAALAGVGLASRERGSGGGLAGGVGWALLAALGFGFYYPPLHAAATVDPYWAVFLFRCTSATLTGGALLALRAPLPPRRELPVVALAGLLDTGGNLLYALAASERGLVSVVSVLSSLYPIVTVALASLLLHERPAPWQWLGVGLTFAGIGLIAAG
ncbi:MAG TPA: EamA family transporter [Gaiellaceae bacterium]|nr:EamA family transporter [Gaiellaceae bacterium]